MRLFIFHDEEAISLPGSMSPSILHSLVARSALSMPLQIATIVELAPVIATRYRKVFMLLEVNAHRFKIV